MLVLIDLQNDYLHPQGKFYFEETHRLIEPLRQRLIRAVDSGEAVIYTLNLYGEEDGRPRGERDWAATLYEPFRQLLGSAIQLTKYYYGISPEASKRILDRFEKEPPSAITVGGVETNLCVMANAVVFQNMFPKAEIVLSHELIASGTPELASEALRVMAGMNMKILDHENIDQTNDQKTD